MRRQRGYATPADIAHFAEQDIPALYRQLHAKDAVARTAAVHLLARRVDRDDPTLVDTLLEMLAKEHRLYTRLEICAALEEGGSATAERMIIYLGHIGDNQHRELPKAPSKKHTYPLPRDIIARSLGRMETGTLPLLLDTLENGQMHQVSEIIDAIGFMTYHHPNLAVTSNYYRIVHALYTHQDAPVIVWKCLTCLSAFPLNDCAEFLIAFMAFEREPLLLEEAQRSLLAISGQR